MPGKTGRGVPLWMAWGMAVFAIHAGFVLASLVPGWRALPLLTADAASYHKLGQNLASRGVFSSQPGEPYLWEPYRTPGYPALIGVSLLVFGRPEGTLFAAALFAGVTAAMAIRLCESWRAGRTAQHACGVLAALLPNSLGLSAQLLTDALTGFIFLAWTTLFLKWLTKQRWRDLALAMTSLVFLQLLKPTFFIAHLLVAWGCLVIPAKWNVRTLAQAATWMAALTVIPVGMAVAIARDHGVFSPNLLGVQAVRDFAQAEYLVQTEGGDFKKMRAHLQEQDIQAAERLLEPASFDGRLYLVKQAEASKFVLNNPAGLLSVMTREAASQFIAPQEFAFSVIWGPLPRWARALGSLVTLGLWGLAALGVWRLGGTTSWRLPLFWAGIIIFFLATGSVSHLVEGRLRFPADMACLPLMATGFEVLAMRIARSGEQENRTDFPVPDNSSIFPRHFF